MGSMLRLYYVCAVYVLYSAWRGAAGQAFLAPWRFFENMTFDMINRGDYNTSFCIEELLGCWEIVKPDMLCSYSKYYASVCSLMHEYCTEFYGDQDNYWHRFHLTEGFCKKSLYWT